MTWGEFEALVDDHEARQPNRLSRAELDECYRIGMEAMEREKERKPHGG